MKKLQLPWTAFQWSRAEMDSSVTSFSVFSYFSSPPMQQHLVHSALGFQECGRGFLTSMLNEMEQAR